MRRASQKLIELIISQKYPTHKIVDLTGFSPATIRYNARKLGILLPKGVRFNDLTGKSINKLKVLERIMVNGKFVWKCKCACGQELTITSSALLSGKQISCGCILTEIHNARADKSGHPAANSAFHLLKGGAKRRGLICELSLEQFIDISTKNCVYCGQAPNRSVKNGNAAYPFFCNGIDRIDNTLGYILTNCKPCCWTCNRSKGSLTKDEWKQWIEQLINFNTCKK